MKCDVFAVVHFARTCDDKGVYVTKDSSEIIEIAWLLLDSSTLTEITRGSILVRPSNTPVTAACTNITGLTWDHLDSGASLAGGINKLHLALQETIFSKGQQLTFVVSNAFDIKVELPREARDKGLNLPVYIQYPRLYDLRQEYTKWQQTHPESQQYISSSLSSICAALDVVDTSSFYPTPRVAAGGPRRALEETELLARIMRALVAKSQPGDVFQRPVDLNIDLNAFLAEKSKVVFLSNLPHDVTLSELESWFTQYGGRPIAFWTLKTPDQFKPTQTGFTVFASHQEALDSLNMNGRALNDRAIEVSPSSATVLERAREILSSFPSSKNRPRPGDWTCTSCGFSNFQRRTACFRCNFPQPVQQTQHKTKSFHQYQNPMDVSSHQINGKSMALGLINAHIYNSNGTHLKPNGVGSAAVPFRAGDWKCGNDGCSYHNFAKNINCLKCGAPRITAAVFGGDAHHNRFPGQHQNQNSNQHQHQHQPITQFRPADPNTGYIYGANGPGVQFNPSHAIFTPPQPQHVTQIPTSDQMYGFRAL